MSNDLDPQTEAAVIADLALKAATPAQISIQLPGYDSPVPAVAVSPSVRIISLETSMAAPLRQTGTTELLTLDDLRNFVAHQSTKEATVIFADKDKLLFTAILNHPSLSRGPAWMDHRATVQLKKPRQLLRWMQKSGTSNKMSQEQFALFLEENLNDIVEPNATEVLHFAETLEARRTEIFKSSIRTTTGETNLVFSSERDGEQSTRLIENFKLGLPLFDGGQPWKIEVKLYHRVIEQRLSFWFELRHLDHMLDTAWAEQIATLRTEAADLATIYEGTAPRCAEVATERQLSGPL